MARDFNRLVQDLRKTSGLQISGRIVLKYAAHARIAAAVEAHIAYLRNVLLAERIEHHQSWRTERSSVSPAKKFA